MIGTPSKSAIDEKIAELNGALGNAETNLAAAQRIVARVHLGDSGNPLAASEARGKICDLRDAIDGLQQLARIAEASELRAEIKSRETAHEKAAERLAELKAVVDEGKRPIDGTGTPWRKEVRRSSVSQNENFERYAAANTAYNAEAKAIAQLVNQLRALEAAGLPN